MLDFSKISTSSFKSYPVCATLYMLHIYNIYEKIRSLIYLFYSFQNASSIPQYTRNKKTIVNWPEPRFDVQFLWFHQITPPSFLVVLESSAYQTQGLGPRS